ncbi:dephospho-CoA kinase [Notoacmeibacter ruber]|uniref:Dephospho-CoA kinase n=1 Tax=Notoacmeibacter ruber TaxID=2670375 RepID=A0A3L7JKV7_9HYPH|nr:dephospho-CoA kinase [Notoacmeibacter ruber]RLQ89152.1 dephospho-CoA kinase [Notoacmeibacter ruber]
MKKVGLTGSIGMGKSTTARMFAKSGIPVHDADATVHRLYAKGGAAVKPVGEAFPDVVRNGAVDRDALREHVVGNDEAMAVLERIVHPLVQADETAFLAEAELEEAPFVLFDIPLLYETGGDARMDAVIVVTAPADIQRKRVLERETMSEEDFERILARQVPDAEKRNRADFIIETGEGMEPARRQVREVIEQITAMDE